MRKKNIFGFSLVEVVISMSILAMLSLGIIGMFQFALRVLALSKGRNSAIALANEKIEIIRNLSYEEVGTNGGVPPGPIEQNENLVLNGITFAVNTQVIYIDDTYDDVTPADTAPNDYKQAKISVTWNTPLGPQTIYSVTNIAPRGLETCEGGGALRIIVFDANGLPVEGATVHVVNNSTNPTIDTTRTSSPTGVVLLACTPESQDSYEITVTKDGYSSDYTCAINSSGSDCVLGNPVPTNPHASVVLASLTEVSFGIDLLATLDISTISQVVPTEWIVNSVGLDDQLHGSMAVCFGSNEIVFAWQDFLTGQGKIHGQKYDVATQSHQWGDPNDIDISTASNSDYVDIAADSSCNSYYAWSDNRNGNLDVHMEKYDTNGNELLGGNNKLETDASNADQTQPRIVANATGDALFITWEDDRDSLSDIYLQKLNNDTTQVWVPEVKVNTNSGSGSGTGLQELPDLTINADDNLFIVWQDDRNGDFDIYSQRVNSDGDLLWSPDIKLNSENSSFGQINPRIAMSRTSNLYFYVTWQDGRSGNDDIYLQKFDDSGAKIWANDVLVNSNTDASPQERPVIAIDSNEQIYVVWQDLRNGNYDIYGQMIDSAGNKLLPFDFPVVVSGGGQRRPDAATTANDLLAVTWEDDSGGDWDIKAVIVNGDPSSIVPVANVPLRIHTTKQIGNNPVIYKYDQNVSTDGSGSLILNDMEWDPYFIEVQPGFGFNLISSDPVSPVSLNPNSTLKVYLNVES
ncbi:MAG: hypothetical protein COT81_00355 [Candidatus Buchananbacteria bacterium CG10_big_fil_rev_8_21_14_0_10_42_9]|uniref:Uncharacterized protein n=1 Tax=Candidatus Buchananbacteria bacterium CG10_big_fil_rev_8_21_14_0_10_42_9 TaxID=1974526 RepID=A0A2H0W4N3_9BACT|nr:MAG: hypothetical protein COT81_00355 [Candidatus Buchananbacteria bacterium CG10_big_fil_rev_8_21_14_0_10_42_9]